MEINMGVWAIYQFDRILYVGLHSTEEDCWQIYLGWPSDQEVHGAKNQGKRCERVSIKRNVP